MPVRLAGAFEMKTILIILMFVTNPHWTWNATQITQTYHDAYSAMQWWNQQLGVEAFRVNRLDVMGMPDMYDWDWRWTYTSFYLLPRQPNTHTMYLYRYPIKIGATTIYGWAYPDHDVIRVTHDNSLFDELNMRHEMGHWLGLTDACYVRDLMCNFMYQTLDPSGRQAALQHLGIQ